MVAACGEAMSVEGTKRTNVIAAATSAFDPPPPDLVCRAEPIVLSAPRIARSSVSSSISFIFRRY